MTDDDTTDLLLAAASAIMQPPWSFMGGCVCPRTRQDVVGGAGYAVVRIERVEGRCGSSRSVTSRR